MLYNLSTLLLWYKMQRYLSILVYTFLNMTALFLYLLSRYFFHPRTIWSHIITIWRPCICCHYAFVAIRFWIEIIPIHAVKQPSCSHAIIDVHIEPTTQHFIKNPACFCISICAHATFSYVLPSALVAIFPAT